MKTQFYDLNIETLDDGTIRLEQRDYCGESVILDLHPAQVAYIADGVPATNAWLGAPIGVLWGTVPLLVPTVM